MEILFLAAVAAVVWVWALKMRAEKLAFRQAQEARAAAARLAELENEKAGLQARIDELAKYQAIIDAEKAAQDILSRAREVLGKSRSMAENSAKEASQIIVEAKRKAEERLQEAQASTTSAHAQAAQIIAAAKRSAEEIAGEAYGAMARAKEYSATAEAMKGVIHGYGDAYIVPTYSLLDDLADEFGHTDAGSSLKRARETTRTMILQGRAAACDYAESNRKETAIRFVVDAFNGKVDSVLSRAKTENHGKLEQEIRGAFHLVNHNGAAFRNARITDEYLNARLDELKWAATAQALREKEREEQRALREQIREEEKARREYERAMKEAAQEENAIKKAMERVQQQVAKANESQRAEFEAKLQELEEKLKQAEEKGQRALSMAQQTRVGHVYVISNVGSFGDHVFKIGMTRRLDPADRVRELGDASVPFHFDVHAMIYSEDAPALERALHLHFMRSQVNKVNPRKEFFRLDLAVIRAQIEGMGIAAHWTMASEAHDYRETLRIEQAMRENPELDKEWQQYQLAAEAAVDEEAETV